MALDEALYRPPALALLLSPSLRQSGELFRTVMDLHRKLGMVVEPDAESSLRVERGYASVALLIIDEAARVNDPLYRAVKPMLAVSGGRIVLL